MLSIDLGLFPLEVPKHVAYSVTGQVLFVEKSRAFFSLEVSLPRGEDDGLRGP